jgi:polyhydroxyalkanoate synthesis regulator phasin
MTEPVKSENLNNEAKEAKAAIERGENIHDAVRNIMLAALQKGRFDSVETKRVVRSVIQGATLGLGNAGDKSQQALRETLAGIDDALAKLAEASKLAIEEAAGRLHDYRKHDLERAFNDMRTLEGMFLDSIKEVADQSVGEAKKILQDLLRHARDSGTTAGDTAKSAIAALEKKFGRTLREVAAAGADIALSTGSNLAEAASGFLAGIAEALDTRAKNMRNARK